ncbi:MAG: hypothetical protein ACYS80_25860 [Planctomycetota bacterium]|jgi:predicted transcriptional regulator
MTDPVSDEKKLALIAKLDEKIEKKAKERNKRAVKRGTDSIGRVTRKRIIDYNKAAAYRKMGLSFQEIADLMGVTADGVSKAMKRMKVERGEVDYFKEHRADIMALYQKRILYSLTDADIEKIPPGSRMTAFGILYDKERLERGQSTSNQTQIQLVIQAYQDTKTLLEQLGEKPEKELPVQAIKVIEKKLKQD